MSTTNTLQDIEALIAEPVTISHPIADAIFTTGRVSPRAAEMAAASVIKLLRALVPAVPGQSVGGRLAYVRQTTRLGGDTGEFFIADRDTIGECQYLHKADAKWRNGCGSENFFETREAAQAFLTARADWSRACLDWMARTGKMGTGRVEALPVGGWHRAGVGNWHRAQPTEQQVEELRSELTLAKQSLANVRRLYDDTRDAMLLYKAQLSTAQSENRQLRNREVAVKLLPASIVPVEKLREQGGVEVIRGDNTLKLRRGVYIRRMGCQDWSQIIFVDDTNTRAHAGFEYRFVDEWPATAAPVAAPPARQVRTSGLSTALRPLPQGRLPARCIRDAERTGLASRARPRRSNPVITSRSQSRTRMARARDRANPSRGREMAA